MVLYEDGVDGDGKDDGWPLRLLMLFGYRYRIER